MFKSTGHCRFQKAQRDNDESKCGNNLNMKEQMKAKYAFNLDTYSLFFFVNWIFLCLAVCCRFNKTGYRYRLLMRVNALFEWFWCRDLFLILCDYLLQINDAKSLTLSKSVEPNSMVYFPLLLLIPYLRRMNKKTQMKHQFVADKRLYH